MFDLTKKDTPFVWSPLCKNTFSELKQKITSAPILTLPNEEQPFRVKADSSEFASGGVLSQLSTEDGKWHSVTFLSKSLLSVQQNYKIYDKELFAIVCCLEEWRHFLEGMSQKFEIQTDHRNLKYFKTPRT